MISFDTVINHLYGSERSKCREDYYESLYEYAKNYATRENALIVEIGTCFGHSAMFMAAAIHGTTARVITVDPGYKFEDFRYRQSTLRDEFHGFHHDPRYVMNQFYVLGLQEYITVVPDFSDTYLKAWDVGREIDFLFIDGDHSLEGVALDVHWMQHVRPGGHAAFDDWCDTVKPPVFAYLKEHPEWHIIYESTSKSLPKMCVTLMDKK